MKLDIELTSDELTAIQDAIEYQWADLEDGNATAEDVAEDIETLRSAMAKLDKLWLQTNKLVLEKETGNDADNLQV